MFEVENKYLLLPEKEKQVFDKLKELQVHFTEVEKQDDSIFVTNKTKGFNIIKGDPVIRIRSIDDQSWITLKRKRDNSSSLELETKVENPKIMESILENVSFHKELHINKVRKEAKYKNINICYDQVHNLGHYLELEILAANEQEEQEAEKTINEFAKELGLTSNELEHKKYDTLVYEKEHGND